MKSQDSERAQAPRLLRNLLVRGWVILVLTAAGFVLAFWPGRLGPRQFLSVCAAAAALTSLAAIQRKPGRWLRIAAASLLLAPLAASVGAGVWLYRQYQTRAPTIWSAIDLDRPELEAVKTSLSGGKIDEAESALLKHFRDRSPVDLDTLPPIEDAEANQACDLILSSKYKLLEFDPVELPKNLSWDENPLNDRTWQWGLHTMPFVPLLAARFARTGEDKFLARAEELVLDWIDDNQLYLYQQPSPFSWHDHAMALRVRGWLPFWETWVRSPRASAKDARKILEGIVLHGERLTRSEYYNEGHNHGMEQDFALLAIAAGFPELKLANEWRKLAAWRLEAQTSEIVSPAGVQLEHTPYYHLFTLDILSDAQEFARRVGVPESELNLDPALRRMARYVANILKPDGTLPLIGDTPRDPPLTTEHRTLSRFLKSDPVLLFALTQGREGSPGAETVFYKDEGYAIFRDAWKPAPEFSQSFYVFFTAAAHEGRVHKQSDELSFTLFAHGFELLTDAGFHSNQYGDPEREYVTGTSAHNSVLVDGNGFTGWTAKIDACLEGNGWALVQASHSNYADVKHRRTLFYSRPSTIFVIDELRPRGFKPGEPVPPTTPPHDFEQLFHFEARCSATPGESRDGVLVDVGLAKDNYPRLRIEQLAGGRGTARVVRGVKEPLQGWIAVGHRTLVPAPVTIFKERGPEALFVTWIEALEPVPAAAAELVGPKPTCSHDPGTGIILLKWASQNGPREATIHLNDPVEVHP